MLTFLNNSENYSFPKIPYSLCGNIAQVLLLAFLKVFTTSRQSIPQLCSNFKDIQMAKRLIASQQLNHRRRRWQMCGDGLHQSDVMATLSDAVVSGSGSVSPKAPPPGKHLPHLVPPALSVTLYPHQRAWTTPHHHRHHHHSPSGHIDEALSSIVPREQLWFLANQCAELWEKGGFAGGGWEGPFPGSVLS